ncbi:MAG: tRNA (N(6)-L-threonylcarbamoyladenosine(37)-C(2))-methylthiotransferase MtaB, partial [Lachnospiraceae bacterium]|nr:tRNA (N(6)-L-threonylcarbamoyladenosine(37)-C(2))-methylthiotransferase MtaB [Lachnospiraceae bacterium]
MKNVALHNLGCKVNSYELDFVQQMLQENGYNVVPFDEKADIYIVNTCTVTNIADRKSRQMLHRAKSKNPEAVVVAIGCYVQTGKEDVVLDDCIDLAIGNNRKKEIVSIIEAFLQERGMLQAPDRVDKTLQDTTIIDVNNTYEYEEMTLKRTAEHTRAYIKIQDGCNQFCTYCIIPYARGRVRSRRWEDIFGEIEGLVANGYQEIVLTGIHISSYGIDFEQEAWEQGRSIEALKAEGRHDYSGASKLIDLVERIHGIEGLKRIRIGSLEPRIVTEEFARRLAALDKVCPHFHLSLQSGCNATLKRMNRHYTAEEYLRSVEVLRKAFGRPAITTDVIVGFPQETEEEFEQTRAFLEKIGFFEMHIFKYSKRKGTIAAGMSGQVQDSIKSVRSNILLELEKKQ